MDDDIGVKERFRLPFNVGGGDMMTCAFTVCFRDLEGD
jgi:hypothetical protein